MADVGHDEARRHWAGQNWAGNHTYSCGRFVRATSWEQARQEVADARRLRVLGTRHSFNPICDTAGTLLDLGALGEQPWLGDTADSVVVTGATPFSELAPWLQQRGLALPNLGSLPHISVAGACATGTHGSGAGNRVLADGVRALELIGPDGEVRTVRRGEPDFPGSVVALGTLGAVVRLELDVVPTYDVRQDVYDHLPWHAVVERIGEVLASAYSVSVFGRWNDTHPTEVLVKERVGADGDLAWTEGGASIEADAPFRLLGGADHLTLRGEPGPWSERLPHFRADRQPSFGEEIQTEWFVDRDDAVPALQALTALAATDPDLVPLLAVTELRAVRADELWLSPAQGRETVAIHFTWRREPGPVAAVAARIEAVLAPYAARPHWGKVHGALDAAARYPRLDDFRALRARIDPDGVFRNDHVDVVLAL